MITIVEKISNHMHMELVVEQASNIIKSGGLVSFPTETVYGLGANAYSGVAAKKIYEAKGRPSDNPLILHISSLDMLDDIVSEISEVAERFAEKFWPGPLTLILPKGKNVPYEVTGGLETVAVRFPRHKVARRLIEKCGFPLAAPSANSSGKPSPTRASHVVYDLSGKIDMIIDGGACEIGLESTIVDVTSDMPKILRPGIITLEQLSVVSSDITHKHSLDDEKAIAPGMKYKHYSPKAKITIVAGDNEKVVSKINELAQSAEDNGKRVGILATAQTFSRFETGHVISLGSADDMETIIQNFYKSLRKFDFYGIDVIYSEGFESSPLGDALMNRLRKAANNRYIYV